MIATTCAEYFLHAPPELTGVGADALPDSKKVSQPTIRFSHEEPGQHGGKIKYFRRYGPTWGSAFAPDTFDPQGDPRWFVETLGKRAARYFGFVLPSDALIGIPDFAEFTRAIANVNAVFADSGIDPFPLQFYVPRTTTVCATPYTARFAHDIAIPLAQEGTSFVHDMSFHSAGIFLPKHILKYGAEKTRYMIKFSEFLRSKLVSGSSLASATGNYLCYLIKLIQSGRIDSATGLVGPHLATYWKAFRQNPSVAPEHLISNSLREFAVDGLSAFEWMQRALDYQVLAKFPFSDSEKLALAKQSLDDGTVQTLLSEFSKTAHVDSGSTFDPYAPVPNFSALERQICLEIHTRREQTIAATAQLMTVS